MNPDEPKHRAVFLDRDGTIIREVNYLTSADQIELLPGAADALHLLREAGLLCVVVTNQSAVARGMLTMAQLDRIHAELRRRLRQQQADVDAIYVCPHLPEGTVPEYAIECDCRKPAPGLLLRAAQDLDIDLHASILIGDSLRDVEAGKRAGCKTILLMSRSDVDPADLAKQPPDHVASSILAAARLAARLWQ
jgi:D-glycero-D-manno-heptose 1,7-bisphosphate phosphatase